MKKLLNFFRNLFILIIVLTAAFVLYTRKYYKAGTEANTILNSSLVQKQKNVLELKNSDSQIGIIFYPGAKVEYSSYLPLLLKLNEQGLNCFSVKMPFNLAFFASDRANLVIQNNPQITTWYMAGHSLGGAFASDFAGKHKDKITGLILLGSYLYGNFPYEKTLTIYGSEDLILSKEKIKSSINVHEISGANHAQFGDYGEQKGDGIATMDAPTQIQMTINIIDEFLNLN